MHTFSKQNRTKQKGTGVVEKSMKYSICLQDYLIWYDPMNSIVMQCYVPDDSCSYKIKITERCSDMHTLTHNFWHFLLSIIFINETNLNISINKLIAFSALTQLVWWQEGHPTCKKWVVGCWRVYLSGARCRLAYSPADATATHSLASVKSRLVLPFWYRLTRVVSEKGLLNACVFPLIN